MFIIKQYSAQQQCPHPDASKHYPWSRGVLWGSVDTLIWSLLVKDSPPQQLGEALREPYLGLGLPLEAEESGCPFYVHL